jgi:hypothetical protein
MRKNSLLVLRAIRNTSIYGAGRMQDVLLLNLVVHTALNSSTLVYNTDL